MKKKILSIALVVCLLATALVSGTLAYFTDKDEAKNVMTLGGVNIKQNEQEYNENDELVDFKQDKPLMPMVDTRGENDPLYVDGYFNEKMNNVVDKIVTVTNEAKEGAINQDAYVRTIIAFETVTEYAAGTDTVLRGGIEIFDTYIGVLGEGLTYIEDYTITINGQEYALAYKVYDKALAPEETSEPSLKQVFMSPDANNEIATLFGSEYTILAISQGTQTAGFGNAAEALDTAFGAISAEKCVEWFTPIAMAE